MARDRVGLLIIRTWMEPGSTEPFIALVRVSTDVSAGFQNTVMQARTEDVLATVQKWLSDVLSDAERPG